MPQYGRRRTKSRTKSYKKSFKSQKFYTVPRGGIRL